MTAVIDHQAPIDQVDADPVLDVDGMTVDIRTITGTVRAVNDVSFQARRGETLALLGESGCGKSMTATALVGPARARRRHRRRHRHPRRCRDPQREPQEAA